MTALELIAGNSGKEITLNVDKIGYTEKPKQYIGAIRYRLANATCTITPEKLLDMIATGHSFTPAEMSGTTGDSWKQQQVIIADVDNDKEQAAENPLQPSEALAALQQYDIDPFCLYYTFSNSSARPKYRVVLILTEPITDKDKATEYTRRLSEALNTARPGCADTVMADPARLLFGGRRDCIAYKSDTRTSAQQLEALPKVQEDQRPVKDGEQEPQQQENTPQAITAQAAQHGDTLEALEAKRDADIRSFDLAGYILATAGGRIINKGSKTYINPSPLCPHYDCFQVTGALWHEFSGNYTGSITGGTIIDYLMAKRGLTRGEALEVFKFEIMKYSVEEWKRAFMERRDRQRGQDDYYLTIGGIDTRTGDRITAQAAPTPATPESTEAAGETAQPQHLQGQQPGTQPTQTDRTGAQQQPEKLLQSLQPLYNTAALYNGAQVVFITQSKEAADAIQAAGGAAVAIHPDGKALLKQLKNKPTAAALALCLNNDDAGRAATESLDAGLNALDVFHVNGAEITAAPSGPDYRDAAETAQRGGLDDLQMRVNYVTAATLEAWQQQEAERARRAGADLIDDFLEQIQTERYKPLPTGISRIDNALCGGFTRQQIVILGAAPGAGKTALAQWIFEGMAASGTASCIYLNLEMSREQILARSLSRIAARQGNKINALEVLQGYRWTEGQRATVYGAAYEYRKRIAGKMIYNPDGITANLDTILAYCEREAMRLENAGQPAPCVVLDYLQLLRGQPKEEGTEIIKRAMEGFKSFAEKHNTVVFIIIAHNRETNKKGEGGMEAARDTSAIEYSADVQLALYFTDCLRRDGQKGKSPDELTEEEKQHVTLRIVKGRFGGRGTDVDMRFDGSTMTYTPLIVADYGKPSGNVSKPKIVMEY